MPLKFEARQNHNKKFKTKKFEIKTLPLLRNPTVNEKIV